MYLLMKSLIPLFFFITPLFSFAQIIDEEYYQKLEAADFDIDKLDVKTDNHHISMIRYASNAICAEAMKYPDIISGYEFKLSYLELFTLYKIDLIYKTKIVESRNPYLFRKAFYQFFLKYLQDTKCEGPGSPYAVGSIIEWAIISVNRKFITNLYGNHYPDEWGIKDMTFYDRTGVRDICKRLMNETLYGKRDENINYSCNYILKKLGINFHSIPKCFYKVTTRFQYSSCPNSRI